MNSETYVDEISIVIPAYNEENRIGPTLETLVKFCHPRFSGYEIVCVDDGSTDGTWDIIRSMGRKGSVKPLRLARNRGKGYAVTYGMLHSRGRFRFFTDADLPYSLESFDRAMDAFDHLECDVITGARQQVENSGGIKVSVARKIAGRMFSLMASRLVKMDVTDSQCGFKGFTDKAAETIFPHVSTSGYAFDVEIFAQARRHNLKVCTVPVSLVAQAGSKIRLTRDPFFMFMDLIRIAWRMRQGIRRGNRKEKRGNGKEGLVAGGR